MFKIVGQGNLELNVGKFRDIVNSKHPELRHIKETQPLIVISRDRFDRLYNSKNEIEKIRPLTALGLCNYLDIAPSSILVTNGTINHETELVCDKKDTNGTDNNNSNYSNILLNEIAQDDAEVVDSFICQDESCNDEFENLAEFVSEQSYEEDLEHMAGDNFCGDECKNYSSTESVQYESEDLCFFDYMGDNLKKNCSGLLMSAGKKERVSFAIVSFVTYLCMIVNAIPKLKEKTYFPVKAIAGALHKAVLDSDEQTINDLWPGLKNSIADLKKLDALTDEAEIEANTVINKLLQSRLDGDDVQKLQAVQAALYWLEDYWPYICYEPDAYGALRNISCILTDAPTDYKIRKNIVVSINSFIHQVSLYDKSGAYRL